MFDGIGSQLNVTSESGTIDAQLKFKPFDTSGATYSVSDVYDENVRVADYAFVYKGYGSFNPGTDGIPGQVNTVTGQLDAMTIDVRTAWAGLGV